MKRIKAAFTAAALITIGLHANTVWAETARWPEERANAWYAQQPWLTGSNYPDGTLYRQREVNLIQRLTGKQ
jgi:hypothetical protein